MSSRPIFYPSFGNRPDKLVGRSRIVQELLEGLASYPGGPDRTVFLAGQRGMGKTALLLELADQAQNMNFIVARVTCGESMLDSIIELIQVNGTRYVDSAKKPISGFSAGALGFSIGLSFTEETQKNYGFRVKLEMLCDRLAQAGKGILILVDEVDPSESQLRTLATTYQELVGNENNIAIVMAGLPSAVSQVLNYRTLTFLNRAKRIDLESISISEVKAYYSSAFKRADRILSDELIDSAAKSTDGFPYLLQLLGYYIVQISEDGSTVSKHQLNRAKKMALEELDEKVFSAILNPLSKTDIEFLTMLANVEGAKASKIEEENGINHSTFQTYRKRLLDAGVLVSQRRGELEFVVPLLADYLRRRA